MPWILLSDGGTLNFTLSTVINVHVEILDLHIIHIRNVICLSKLDAEKNIV